MPLGATLAGKVLSWTAPGGDLMCGTASSYQIVTSANPITPQSFAAATPLSGAPTPAAAGSLQTYTLPPTAQRYVAIRAIDAQGNIGRPAMTQTAR